MKDFRSLIVWRRAHSLVLAVYRATERFPTEERFGLTSQVRRAAVSVPTNIAEGCGRGGEKEFARFLSIAMGSASEVQYLVLLAGDLALLEATTRDGLEAQVNEVKKMLATLRGRLASS